MAKKPQAYEPSYEDFKHMPGIFESDSELADILTDIRKNSVGVFTEIKRSNSDYGAVRQHSHLNLKTLVI